MRTDHGKPSFILKHYIILLCIIILSLSDIYAQSTEGKHDQIQVWEKNCALRNIYWTELIFTATETEDGVFWVAEDRSAYLDVFDGLILESEPKMKSRQKKILKLIEKAPGGDQVIISSELMREVDKLWEDIMKKAQSLEIQCK